MVEDAVQHSMVTALAAWEQGVPDEPTAWLYRVAHNKLVQDLRREQGRARILERAVDSPHPGESDSAFFAEEIRDDMLRMVF
ncbi:MAG TPA: sigma factor, partial [Kofleriaceae bacterium]